MSDRVISFADNQRSPAAAERDPFLDLVARLSHEANSVANREPALASAARKLEQDVAGQPEKAQERQTRVATAYLLQDVEKLLGPINTVPPALRQEMDRLAVTVPGLENERLKTMMSATPQIQDRELTTRIRRLAHSTAQHLGDQNRPDEQTSLHLQSLEASFASAAKAFEKALEPAPGSIKPDPVKATGAPENKQAGPTAGPVELNVTPSAADAPIPPNAHGSSQSQSADTQQSSATQSQQNSDALPDRKPETSQRPSAPANTASSAQSAARGVGVLAQVAAEIVQGVRNDVGIISQALGALYRSEKNEEPAFNRPASPMADRIKRHEQALQEQRDEKVIQGAQASQQAALDAMNAFANGPASNILTRIQDAAKNNPGGMQAVLSEMRPGGQFANLRTQFNADLTLERGMAAAGDKVAASLQEYSAGREAVAKIGARNGTGTALDAKFEQMDAEIGQAASMLPSRADGKSIMDDLSDKIREILQRAMSIVKAAFTPGAQRNASASSGPSPS